MLEDIHNIFKSDAIKWDIIDDIVTYTIDDTIFSIRLNVKVELANDDFNSYHFYRVLKMKYSEENYTNDALAEIVEHILNTLLPNIFQICTVCGETIKMKCTNIYACEKEYCQLRLEDLFIDDYVTEFYKRTPAIFKFLVQTTISTMNSQKRGYIFNPFPMHLKKVIQNKANKFDVKKVEDVNDYDKFVSLIPETWKDTDISQLVKIIDGTLDDQRLYRKLGEELYGVLKFILKSNRTYLKSYNFLDKENTNLLQFEVTHSPVIEEKFKTDTPFHLFHGSSTENWHSILRNGLKNCSSSVLQANGAAYGSGIYLAKDSGYSYNYSKGNLWILGVCQVLNSPKYDKGNGIFVVPDEENVILRYLLMSTRQYATSNMHLTGTINNYFQQEIQQNKRLLVSKVGFLNNKRLGREIKMIEKHKYCNELFKLTLKDGNIYDWDIEMLNINGKIAKVNLKFPEGYPLEPPFARLVEPQIKPKNGWLTKEGAFCIDLFSSEKWKPVINIETLIIQLRALLIDDEYEIMDGDNYNETQARDSYRNLIDLFRW